MSETRESPTGQYEARLLTPSEVDTGVDLQVPVRVDVAAVTHPGRVRPNNEDHFIVARLGRKLDVLSTNLPEGRVPHRFEEFGYALAVADGMGGASAGEVASALALSLGTRLTLDASVWPTRLDGGRARELVETVGGFFREIDRAVSEQARRTPGLAGMGTTLTVVYSVGLDLITFHVGDSRAYLLRDGRLTQLTRDQTVAQALADSGQISPDEVSSHDLRHVLTQAIGAESGDATATARQVRLAHEDRLLLCTDGLTDLGTDAEIAKEMARAPTAQAACDALLDLALDRGGRDNVTVITAFYAVGG